MAKADINLFKAAGGERAKATKRSPVSIMLFVGLILIVVALGVAVYFNLQVNEAKNDYDKKLTIQSNYERTMKNGAVKALAKEYSTVVGDIESAAAINTFVETRSALFPEATEAEIEAVHRAILNFNTSYSLNDISEDEEEDFTPRDYRALREYFYDEEAEGNNFPDKELFYFALEKLQEKQEEDEDVNVWYAYYRSYLVVVFTGGEGVGLERLVTTLVSYNEMGGQLPFSKVTMDNDDYQDSTYVAAKCQSIPYNYENYNILLLPMKSVIERAFDILEARAMAFVSDNTWAGREELAKYGVDDIEFNNEMLSFKLILPEEIEFTPWMDAFDQSYFFDVSPSVYKSNGEMTPGGVAYTITLNYKNRPELETPIDGQA